MSQKNYGTVDPATLFDDSEFQNNIRKAESEAYVKKLEKRMERNKQRPKVNKTGPTMETTPLMGEREDETESGNHEDLERTGLLSESKKDVGRTDKTSDSWWCFCCCGSTTPDVSTPTVQTTAITEHNEKSVFDD
eukprot:PhF_6_TR9155/c0_g1_i1/m.14237